MCFELAKCHDFLQRSSQSIHFWQGIAWSFILKTLPFESLTICALSFILDVWPSGVYRSNPFKSLHYNYIQMVQPRRLKAVCLCLCGNVCMNIPTYIPSSLSLYLSTIPPPFPFLSLSPWRVRKEYKQRQIRWEMSTICKVMKGRTMSGSSQQNSQSGSENIRPRGTLGDCLCNQKWQNNSGIMDIWSQSKMEHASMCTHC